MNYLFVCAGNTCRSPMAAILMRKAADEAGFTNVVASSAGISVLSGASANECAQNAVSRFDANLSHHSARRFTSELARDKCVLCMDEYVMRCALAIAPNSVIFDICKYSGVSGDIRDPYMLGQQEYDMCAEKLYKCVKNILKRDGGAI